MGGGDWRKGFAKSQPLCDVNQLNICPQRSCGFHVRGKNGCQRRNWYDDLGFIWCELDWNSLNLAPVIYCCIQCVKNRETKNYSALLCRIRCVLAFRSYHHLLKVQTKYMWVSLTFFVGKHPNPPHPPLNDKSPRVCSESLSKSSVGLLSSKKEWTAFNKNILFLV